MHITSTLTLTLILFLKIRNNSHAKPCRLADSPSNCMFRQAPTEGGDQMEDKHERDAGTPSPMSTGSGGRPGDSDEQRNNTSECAVVPRGKKDDAGAPHVLLTGDSPPEGWMLKVGQLDKC